MVIVSHDREFLDRVCNKIVDVEEGVTVSYSGNYSRFLDAKKARLAVWREQYEKQTRYIKEEEKWIKKSKTIPSMAQQVTAKEMALEKFLKSEELIQPPPRDKKFRFRFPPAPRCGQNVLETSKLGHGYGTGHDSLLFDDVEIQVDRGERVGFVGPNGAGLQNKMPFEFIVSNQCGHCMIIFSRQVNVNESHQRWRNAKERFLGVRQ